MRRDRRSCAASAALWPRGRIFAPPEFYGAVTPPGAAGRRAATIISALLATPHRPQPRSAVSDAYPQIDRTDDDSSSITLARSRLDFAVRGYNRHAILVEHYRLAVRRFLESRQAFAEGAADRERLRTARASAEAHRDVVRAAVSEFVRQLRDAGMAPEVALVAVKHRLCLSVTVTTPGAPSPDAALLEVDASSWAIKAYYDAA